MRIERIGGIVLQLGEGPLWDTDDQALYLVDTLGCEVLRYTPADERFERWAMPAPVGSLALRTRGGAVVALATGFHLLDLETGAVTRAADDPEKDDPDTLFNDGKVDRRGRFVSGTVDTTDRARPVCGLYSLDRERTVTRLDDGFIVTNGPCWSPDDRTFYVADTVAGEIYAYDYDVDTGGATDRRVFADTKDLGGVPDGATVDADGRLWSAILAAGKIACFTPDGSLDRVVDVPLKLISSVMFGGPDLDRLYCTSISVGPGGRPGEPGGGHLLVITDLDATGLPEPRYAG